jgi:glutamate racemase
MEKSFQEWKQECPQLVEDIERMSEDESQSDQILQRFWRWMKANGLLDKI